MNKLRIALTVIAAVALVSLVGASAASAKTPAAPKLTVNGGSYTPDQLARPKLPLPKLTAIVAAYDGGGNIGSQTCDYWEMQVQHWIDEAQAAYARGDYAAAVAAWTRVADNAAAAQKAGCEVIIS